MWPTQPQRIVYTAQTGLDARLKLMEDQVPVLRRHVSPLIERVTRSAGMEAVWFKNGSQLTTQAVTETAGHGRGVNLSVRDEMWADEDNRRAQALGPMMVTVADAQGLVPSTAGTVDSLPLKRLVEHGRLHCEDPDTTTAYFEWSAADDADPDDEAVWWGCMPALGFTQTLEVVRHERATQLDGEFRRAYLNQWWDAAEAIISSAAWAAVRAPGSRVAESGVVFGVDATRDGMFAAIVAADSQGRVEVVDGKAGTAWVAARLVGLLEKWPGSTWAADSGGPVCSLLELVPDGRSFTTSDMRRASQGFLNSVLDGRLRVFPSPALDAAVQAASRRQVGDSWIWNRDTGADASPLLAATVATWAASTVSTYDPLNNI